jgi:hypothetical protein
MYVYVGSYIYICIFTTLSGLRLLPPSWLEMHAASCVKAKTVFKAYDFNHENSIGLDELTIMLMATANGNAKLHGMPTKSESFWRGIAVTCSAGRSACSLDTWLTWLADFLDADLSLDPASPSAITLDDAVAKFGIT